MKVRSSLAMVAVAAIAVAACSPSVTPAPSASPSASGAAASPSASGSPGPSPTPALTKVSLEIGSATNAEFAGYVAAQVLGYYANEGLQVSLVNSDPATRTYVGTSGPEFTIAAVPDVLAAREHGSDLVDIAQIFQRSGTMLMTWKKDGFTTACDLAGKKVGLWPSPADLDILAAFKACSPPLGPAGYTRVDTGHDVAAFLNHSVAAIEASTWAEEAQVLEATNPTTKAQYTTGDLTLLGPVAQQGTLQDAIFARAAWLKGTGNRDLAVSFVKASIEGWVYCRDHQDDCVQFVTKANPSLGTSDQRWMLNAINPLIWPSAKGAGIPDPDLWTQTVNIAKANGVITAAPGADANDQTIVSDAAAQISGQDLVAAGWQTGVVAVAPGGR